MNLNIAPLQAHKLTVNAILIYDAVNVYAKALEGLGKTKVVAEPLQCMNSPFISWSNGFKLIHFMRVVSLSYLFIFSIELKMFIAFLNVVKKKKCSICPNFRSKPKAYPV